MADFLTSSSRYLALVSRNPLATTSFVYAVLTTRIYCRPDCPSRLARRANITFFDNFAEAAAAGFRPCKRCMPDMEKVGNPQVEAVERACRKVMQQRKGRRGEALDEVTKELGWTKSHCCRVFKKVKGMTVENWAKKLEREEAVTVDELRGAPNLAKREEERKWDEWLDYSLCSTSILAS